MSGNTAASVKQRLLNIAVKQKEDFNLLQVRYATERFLYRLSVSPYSEDFLLKRRLERESMVMSKEMREEKEREQRIKVNDFKTLQKRYRSELQKIQAELMQQLQTKITAITQEVGKKEGYLLIMDKRGVIYAPTSVDLTDKLIQRLNKK